jgi:hypothetical protein
LDISAFDLLAECIVRNLGVIAGATKSRPQPNGEYNQQDQPNPRSRLSKQTSILRGILIVPKVSIHPGYSISSSVFSSQMSRFAIKFVSGASGRGRIFPEASQSNLSNNPKDRKIGYTYASFSSKIIDYIVAVPSHIP